MKNFEDIKFIIYTNGGSLHLADITADKLKEFGPKNLNLDIITNGLNPNYENRHKERTFVHSTISSNGSQFTEVLFRHLFSLSNKYIVLLCDDYITTHPFTAEDFTNLADFAEMYNIGSINLQKRDKSRTQFHKNFDNEPYRDLFHIVSNQEVCRFSVQPTLWNKEALQTITSENIGFDVHKFESDLDIKERYDYLTLGINWHNVGHYNNFPPHDLHFIFSYIEVVRHGAFRLAENGFPVSNEIHMTTLIKSLVEEYNMVNDPIFSRVLSKYGRSLKG